jgi:hypothetical protein
MNALVDELTQLRLYGMVQYVTEILAQKKPSTWQIAWQKLIDSEPMERDIDSMRYQTRAARLPHYKDLTPLIIVLLS